MTDTRAAANAVLADRAERIFDVLRHRDPEEADKQACSMVMAGLAMLKDARGIEAVTDLLGKVGPILAGQYPGGPLDVAAPAPVVQPVAGVSAAPVDEAATSLAVEVGTAIRNHLNAIPRAEAAARASAAIAGAGAFLREAFGPEAALDALSGVADAVRPPEQPAPVTASPGQDPDALALRLLDGLRELPADEAGGQARAAIWGASAHLIEQRGPAYAAAVAEGLLVNAHRHVEVWGASPRPAGAPLH